MSRDARTVPASSSSSSSSSADGRHKRKYPRAQLLKCLEILGPITPLLPHELPPSPPVSPPPTTGSKRKHDSHDDAHNKKPRISDPSTSRLPPVPPFPHPPRPGHESSEDGEVREDLPAFHTSLAAASNVPVRRPRRCPLPVEHFQELYHRYMYHGRLLKHSSQKRLDSTFQPSHPSYKPLADPPAPGTSYHKYGHLFSRLERVESLLCFAYAFWAKDIAKNEWDQESWESMDNFISYVKEEWQLSKVTDERERTFIGLIYMTQAFIDGRAVSYFAKHNYSAAESAMQVALGQLDLENARNGRGSATQAVHPPPVTSMLPSPASSAGSTPTSVQGTPNASASGSTPVPSSAPAPSQAPALESSSKKKKPELVHFYEWKNVPDAMNTLVKTQSVAQLRNQSRSLKMVGYYMQEAQRYLTLPAMARHFPRTFARMMYSSLAPTDEKEPDVEDEEGELFWPGNPATGDGLAWVCAMGKAMVKEFGKAYGYKGIDGIVAGLNVPPPPPIRPPKSSVPRR